MIKLLKRNKTRIALFISGLLCYVEAFLALFCVGVFAIFTMGFLIIELGTPLIVLFERGVPKFLLVDVIIKILAFMVLPVIVGTKLIHLAIKNYALMPVSSYLIPYYEVEEKKKELEERGFDVKLVSGQRDIPTYDKTLGGDQG